MADDGPTPREIHDRDQGNAAMRELADRLSSYYAYLRAGGFNEAQAWDLVCDHHDTVIGRNRGDGFH